jgi:AraC-like DNA-binding protein
MKYLKNTFSTRQYMQSEDFEIFYYDDTNLSSVNTHSHNYYEFYLFLSGDISMYIQKKKYHLVPGDTIVIPPGIPHCIDNESPQTSYRRFVLWVSCDFFKELVRLSPDYGYMASYARESRKYIYHNDTLNFNLLQAKVLQLLREIHTNRFGRIPKISLAIHDLILTLSCMAQEQNEATLPARAPTLFENLLLYIENHLDEELSLEQLSKVFFVNKYHISHLFKKQLGLSVHQLIVKKRLSLCCNALLSEPGISQTFLRYGFHDYSSFYRAFKKEYGMSPKEYRERNRTPL